MQFFQPIKSITNLKVQSVCFSRNVNQNIYSKKYRNIKNSAETRLFNTV